MLPRIINIDDIFIELKVIVYCDFLPGKIFKSFALLLFNLNECLKSSSFLLFFRFWSSLLIQKLILKISYIFTDLNFLLRKQALDVLKSIAIVFDYFIHKASCITIVAPEKLTNAYKLNTQLTTNVTKRLFPFNSPFYSDI